MSTIVTLFLVIVGVIVAFAVLLGLYALMLYNKMIGLRNRVQNAWAQIDVQLQRRLDLIPNIVETVKGYAKHEAETLQVVVAARNMAISAGKNGSQQQQIEANNMLTGALKSLFALAEAYPDLKANQNYLQLQEELSQTEDKISYMRQSYNDVVMNYNTTIQRFPAMFFARMFGFFDSPMYQADAGAAQPPKVSF
ncbi:MAG: LemA family protein [Actinomycetaceae bacterium]|nr:LemA family protein [Actinomycetaceae bacterium]